MATPTATPTRPSPRDEKVYHPLDRLKGIIRRYVVIEGVLSVLIFLLAWFTLALVLDYGIFKAFTWDWVQDGAWWLRLVTLVVALGLLAGILVFRIVRRLTTEFSYPSLALVLENRYPKLLGDRLITAVELADVDDAAKYGYSKAMIRQTIDEARERVGQANVHEAFNWRRLRIMGLIVVGSVVGLLFTGFLSHAIAAGQIQPVNAAWKSYHVASIVVERDVLLLDTPWPRRALLELVDVPEKGIRVPRDSGKASIRVKAYRWVITDRSRRDGWRPMLWSDVTESFVGMPVPSLFGSAGSPGATLTLVRPDATADDVLENPALLGMMGTVLGEENGRQLKAVIDRLKEMAADPSNGRRLRYLDNPSEVNYKFTGVKSAGDGPLKADGGSQFSGDITGLKDDVLFSVRAEDYRTPQLPIVLVPTPSLLNLTKVEYQPAYRHYASPLVPDPANPNGSGVPGGYSLLADLRQTMPEERLTLTGKQTIFSVPLGSEVVITGVTEKPITRAVAIPKEGRLPGGKVTIQDGRELYSADPIELPVDMFEEESGGETVQRGRFTIAFKGEYRITGKKGVHFDLKFFNEDRLESQREIQINVLDDNAPVAEVLPDVMRKVGKHFWVTPRAKIPFNPESGVRDDIGLSKVAYVASFKPSDAEAVQAVRAAMFARNATLPAVGGEVGTVGVAFLDYVFQVRSDQANARKEASFGMFAYESRDESLYRETLAQVQKNLAVPKVPTRPEERTDKKVTHVTGFNLETKLRLGSRDSTGTFHKYRWEVEGDYFDLGKIETAPGRKLAVASDDVQTRYDMQLFVEATDANYDAGRPSVRRSEPVELLVVSETDLLVEIGKDEEKIGVKLDDALKKLALARAKYEFVRSKTETHLPDERDAVAVRSKDAMQDVVKARELVESVARDFRRIERECVYNQLPEKNLALFGRFANRGERVMGETPAPVSLEEENNLNTGRSESSPFGILTPRGTFPRAEKGMATAHAAFDAPNQWPDPTTVNSANGELFNLEQEVIDFRRAVGESSSKDKLKNLLISIRDRQDAIARALREAEQIDAADRLAVTPKLGTVGQVLLAKGESKKLRHGINWRQFKEDKLTIKVASSDAAAIIVPAELKLDFEANSIDFEYEVRAGSKDGNFNVTLTPSVGDPIVVQIQVKQ